MGAALPHGPQAPVGRHSSSHYLTKLTPAAEKSYPSISITCEKVMKGCFKTGTKHLLRGGCGGANRTLTRRPPSGCEGRRWAEFNEADGNWPGPVAQRLAESVLLTHSLLVLQERSRFLSWDPGPGHRVRAQRNLSYYDFGPSELPEGMSREGQGPRARREVPPGHPEAGALPHRCTACGRSDWHLGMCWASLMRMGSED